MYETQPTSRPIRPTLDVSRSGHADFIAGSDSGYGMSFYRGVGNGTFQATPVPTNRPPYTGTLIAKDLNGDGRADLVIGSGRPGTLIWLGQVDGTFTAAPFTLDQFGPLVVEDFDRDGAQDLLVSSSAYSLWLAGGNGDGTFQLPAMIYTNTQEIAYAVTGDFNGDGCPDIAFGYTIEDDQGQFHGYISLLLNAAELQIQATQANGNLLLSWAANLGSYQLESTDSLDAAATWSAEPEQPVLSAGRNVVTIPIGTGSKFFRLRQL